jgi:hypothetical protein
MFVTVTRQVGSVTVTASEPLDSGILAEIAMRSQVRMSDAPDGTPVRFLAEFVGSKHADNTTGPTHTFELGDIVQNKAQP